MTSVQSAAKENNYVTSCHAANKFQDKIKAVVQFSHEQV